MKNKKVNVLHIQLSSNLGGIETFLLNVYGRIDRERFQFDFLTTSSSPANGSELSALGGNIIKIPGAKHPIRYIMSLVKVLSNRKYNVVHVHKNSAINIVPIIIAKLTGNHKVIVHSHNTQPSVLGVLKPFHILNRTLFKHLGVVQYACSEVAGEWMFGKNGVFTVVPNGINTEKFKFNQNDRQLMRRELGIGQDSFVIGNIGRFTPQKNQEYLVRVFARIATEIADAYLVLVGDGPEQSRVRKLATDLGVSTRVFFLGVRHDVPKILDTFDCFVMPSLYEGLPIVGIEAQASGLPLYISDRVSPEVVLSDSVKVFSLENSGEPLIKLLKTGAESPETESRLVKNQIVGRCGYSVDNSVKIISEEYCGENQ